MYAAFVSVSRADKYKKPEQSVMLCPLVDGLDLREPDSVQELLCSPSLHRTDKLKWICASICPSLKEKFSTIKATQNEDLVQGNPLYESKTKRSFQA
uniref:Uncharacterized protein n=1 Tax=Cyprinus carpio TaxID=7962 RepID=A0A8C2G7U8_CYPCA